MHNRSRHNCINLTDGVNDPGLAFAGKVGLVKDRLGDQRRGSESEPIKILLEGD
jgi:hypothetical protein